MRSMGQPRHSIAAVSRNDGTIQSVGASVATLPICEASCPLIGANVPMRPWRCSRSMRSSRRRPRSIARYIRRRSSGGMSGSSAVSRLPSLSRMDRCSIANWGSRRVLGMTAHSSFYLSRSSAPDVFGRRVGPRGQSEYPRAMRVGVRVPASSANLGPGFDALGLALALHNEITIEERDGVRVLIEGEGATTLHTDATNVVARGAQLAFDAAGRPFRGAAIRCVNRIPLGRGLGSSAAAWVSGLVGANALLGEPIDRDGLVALATRAEGHPDNVAAAVHGGLTVSCVDGTRVTAVRVPVPSALTWVVLVPEGESATREARAVLPEAVPRLDAVFNVQ